MPLLTELHLALPLSAHPQSFSPDGGYIPRAIFADADGNLRTDIKNTMGNPKYAYFYSDSGQVRNGMYMALKTLKSEGSKAEL